MSKRTIITIVALAGLLGSYGIWHLQERGEITPDSVGDYSRIISLTPSLTEFIYALGCGDRIAGVGDYVSWPPEAADKPRVGGYLNPSLETILALGPDLMVIQGRNEEAAEFCRMNGIAFERFDMDSIADVYAAIDRLGDMLDVTARADSLSGALKAELAAVCELVAGRVRPAVFYSIGHSPGEMNTLFTAGGGSFLTELIAIAGGDNIFSDRPELYPEISKEVLVSRAPDVVIESAMGHRVDSGYVERLQKDWRKFPTIPAVAHGRVHIVTEPYFEIPGPRLGMAAAKLAELIHPGAFDE